MSAKRSGYLALPVILVALAVLTGWACLPSRGQAGADGFTAFSSRPTHSALVSAQPHAPDERWRELVRQGRTHANRSPDAGFTININLTTSDLAGTAPSPLPVSAWVLRDGYPVAAGQSDPFPDPGGNFYQVDLVWEGYPCFGSCGFNYFIPGDQVWVSQAGTEISMTVPTLTTLAEPQDDRLHGEAPPGETLTVYVFPYADPAAVYTHTGSSDPAGSYQIDLPANPGLHRQDTGYLLVEPEPGRRAYVFWVTPLLRAQVGGAVLSGMSPPNAEVSITVSPASGGSPIHLMGYSESDGKFEIDFFYGDYDPETAHSLNPGDSLLAESSGQIFSMTLPLLSTEGSQSDSLVSGQAPAGAALEIRSYTGPILDVVLPIWESQPAMIVTATASPSGEYSAALPLETGNYGAALLTLADEHQAYARYAIPFVYALMGNVNADYRGPLVAGQVGQPLAPITVTIQGPSGYLKDWLLRRARSGGEFRMSEGDFSKSQLVIQPGDTLRVESPAGEEILLVMPELYAEASQPLATVSGTAPPNARLTVIARNVDKLYPQAAPLGSGPGGLPEATLVVTATQAGDFLADFSGLAEFNDYTYGEVEYTTDQGHRVASAWSIGSCPPHPVSVQVGGNQLRFDGGPGCLESQFRLVDAHGEEKYATDLFNGDYWLRLSTPEGVPIPILPGDRIQVSAGGETNESQVPALTLEIDPGSYAVSGQAPPGAQLKISLEARSYYDPFSISVIVTATQEGTYSADLLGGYGYHAGDTLRATLLDQPAEYYAIAVLPRLRVELYDWTVYAWLAPLSPYTLILTTPITTGQVTGYAPSDGSIITPIGSISLAQFGIQVTPGSRLRLESAGLDTELDVPLLTALVDLPSAQVSGQAPPSSHLRLYFQGSSGNMAVVSTQELTADAQGQFTVEFPKMAPLDSANGTLTYISPAGHEAYTRFESPRLSVTLDVACVDGYGPNPGAEITLTLTSADGSFSQSLTVNGSPYDGGFVLCFDRQVQAGDRLELSAEGESILTYTAQPLTARHDFSIQAVLGWAPPGSSPTVIFNVAPWTDISRSPWLEPDGSFGMDTSDLKLSIGDTGRLVVVDAGGNATERIFNITGYPIYLPSVYQE